MKSTSNTLTSAGEIKRMGGVKMILLKKPVRRKIAHWVEMAYDAKVRVHGLWWLRVKGGMGGQRDREDWVADIGVCISVHDYQYIKKKKFGIRFYGSIEKACLGEMRAALENVNNLIQKTAAECNALMRARDKLQDRVRIQ